MSFPPETARAEAPSQPARGSEAFAAAMLVAACLCWAAFFSLTKNWQKAAQHGPGGELLASLTLIGIRPVLALFVFTLLKPRLYLRPTRREWLFGAGLGLLNFVGNVFQIWGLAFTTPARSGFFTSLASLWVPLLALVCFRLRVSAATWLGLTLGIGGIAVLSSGAEPGGQLNLGDAATILASLVFAFFILLLDRLGRTVRSSHLTLSLIAFSGLPALPLGLGLAANGPGVDAWLSWLTGMLQDVSVLRDVLLLTLLSTVLATHLMSTYQPRVPASRAALIYLLEPVFAAALAILGGHDRFTVRLAVGGALILGGNLLAELPRWLRKRGKDQGK